FRSYTRWLNHGMRVAKRLRGHPVLAVGTMKIAALHAEAVSESTTIRVEERLLLNWVTLYPANITPGSVERSAAVEADFANPGLPVGDGAAMSAAIAANPVA